MQSSDSFRESPRYDGLPSRLMLLLQQQVTAQPPLTIRNRRFWNPTPKLGIFNRECVQNGSQNAPNPTPKSSIFNRECVRNRGRGVFSLKTSASDDFKGRIPPLSRPQSRSSIDCTVPDGSLLTVPVDSKTAPFHPDYRPGGLILPFQGTPKTRPSIQISRCYSLPPRHARWPRARG